MVFGLKLFFLIAKVRKVKHWLAEGNAVHVVHSKRFVHFDMNIAAAESLLDCHFFEYRNEHGESFVRTPQYSVPRDIADIIDFIGGTVRLPRQRTRIIAAESSQNSGIKSTPQTLWQQLNISQHDVASQPNGKNLQSVASFLKQYYDPKDLQLMRKAFDLPPQEVNKTEGPNDWQSHIGVEASLDVQYLMGVASGVRTWVWSTPGNNSFDQEPLLVWLDHVASLEETVYVWSVSYQDLENSLSTSYMEHVNTEIAGIVSRGITIGTGSGDWGTQVVYLFFRFRWVFSKICKIYTV